MHTQSSTRSLGWTISARAMPSILREFEKQITNHGCFNMFQQFFLFLLLKPNVQHVFFQWWRILKNSIFQIVSSICHGFQLWTSTAWSSLWTNSLQDLEYVKIPLTADRKIYNPTIQCAKTCSMQSKHSQFEWQNPLTSKCSGSKRRTLTMVSTSQNIAI